MGQSIRSTINTPYVDSRFVQCVLQGRCDSDAMYGVPAPDISGSRNFPNLKHQTGQGQVLTGPWPIAKPPGRI